MSQVIQNRNLSFESERGSDIYKGGEVIRMQIPGSLAPVINNSDSYLMFNFEIPDPSLYVVPDPQVGLNGIFESIQIWDYTQSTLIEQLDSLPLWEGIRSKYSRNKNDENLGFIFEGYTPKSNVLYRNGAGIAPIQTANNAPVTIGRRNNNRGGGFQSQYYKNSMVVEGDNDVYDSKSVPVQAMYRFNCSGLLNVLKSSLTNPLLLDGLVIEFTLVRPEKLLRLQLVENAPTPNINMKSNQNITRFNKFLGYADGNDTKGNAQQNREQINPTRGLRDAGAGAYTGDGTAYEIAGYTTALDAKWSPNNIPGATDIYGIALNKEAGNNGAGVEFFENLAFKIGSEVLVGLNGNAMNPLTVLNGVSGNPVKVAKIYAVDNTTNNGIKMFVLQFNERVQLGAQLDRNAPICVNPNPSSLSDIKYQVSNVKMILNVCDVDAGYLNTLVENAQAGRTTISIDTWRDVRANITTGSLANDILIPTTLNRVYSVLAVPENMIAESILNNNLIPPIDGLRNYNWIIDGEIMPNLPIDLTRVADKQCSALHQVELEKCLDQTSLQLRDMRNPFEFFTVGKRFSADGEPVSLNGKVLKLRLNYTTQPNALQLHFFIYYNAQVGFEGGKRVVME